ncbi:hypothetical protein HRbin36_02409 [bacterium HR36]|nr:hypothetical protein HRbin36_02409 [bacterium HR36]
MQRQAGLQIAIEREQDPSHGGLLDCLSESCDPVRRCAIGRPLLLVARRHPWRRQSHVPEHLLPGQFDRACPKVIIAGKQGTCQGRGLYPPLIIP